MNKVTDSAGRPYGWRDFDQEVVEGLAENDSRFIKRRSDGWILSPLVGHYDTVPAQDNVPGRIAGGAVHGCGATDMKGGVAVALELVERQEPQRRHRESQSPKPPVRDLRFENHGGQADTARPQPGADQIAILIP